MLSPIEAAIRHVAAEKNLPAEAVVRAIEAAIAAAYKKDFGQREAAYRGTFDPKTGGHEIFRVWTVVADEDFENPESELTLDEAKEKKKSAKIGDKIEEKVAPGENFGRIASVAAKQAIAQVLRAEEGAMIEEFYRDRVGQILTGTVKAVDATRIEVEFERAVAFLPREFQIPGEVYRAGQKIKVYLEDIAEMTWGPKMLISRAHPELVRQLFEQEVPEIREGLVVVKRCVREAGVRTKIAFANTDGKTDPIGAAVGQRGMRINSVTAALGSREYIDAIEWSDDPETMIRRALSPAELLAVRIDGDRAEVFVEESQRSLAIGRGGQNVRLAGKLTNLDIDVKNESDLEKVLEAEETGGAPTADSAPEAKTFKEATDKKVAGFELSENEKKLIEAGGDADEKAAE